MTVAARPPPDFLSRTTASRLYHARARKVMPGGVTANVKYFDPYPLAMRKARGCRLWDLDGNAYIDYCLSFGPFILGHGHPRVVKAIHETLDGAGTTTLGTPHELEAIYAERLLRIFRPAGRLRFTVSGTEATLHAIRLARAYRGRPLVAKFEGHYHGAINELLVGHEPGTEERARPPAPESATDGASGPGVRNPLVLPFNNLEETERQIRRHAKDLACVILEPVERSYIAPERGFLHGLREVTEDLDIPLVFDEVMSGFRLGLGGAQHAFGVTPDLTCLGKVIGGGLPCGAFLGRADILDLADPAGDGFFHSSTFAGYPLALAAGMATLDELESPGTFEGLLATTQTLVQGIQERLIGHSIRAQIPRVGTVFSILFMENAPRTSSDTLRADSARRRELDFGLLGRGIFVKPSKPFYMSTVHDHEAIEETLRAFDGALGGLA